MKDVLPSKRFIIVVLAAALVLLVLFLISKFVRNHSYVEETPDQAELEDSVATARANELDTDADGLRDWEEVLWQTDTNNSDTDADGTSDGEEVLSGRDPNIPGPNDTISETQKNVVYTYEDPSETNATDNIFDSILPSALTLARSLADGKSVDPQSIQKLVAPYEGTFKPVRTYFDASDISILSNETENIAQYIVETQKLTAEYSPAVGKELELFATGVSENNINILLQLRTISVRYENFAQSLTRISVPELVQKEHIDLANDMYALSGAVLAMSSVLTDPIQSVGGLAAYQEITTDSLATQEKLLTLLANTL